MAVCLFFFSSRRRHTRWPRDWSSDVCSSDLVVPARAKRKDLPEAAFAGLPEELDDTSIGAITSEGVSASADFRDSIVVGIDLDIQPIDLALTAAKYAEARNLNLVLVSAQPFTGSLWMPVSPADRKSTRLNSSHVAISYAVFCLKKKKK